MAFGGGFGGGFADEAVVPPEPAPQPVSGGTTVLVPVRRRRPRPVSTLTRFRLTIVGWGTTVRSDGLSLVYRADPLLRDSPLAEAWLAGLVADDAFFELEEDWMTTIQRRPALPPLAEEG